MTREHYTLDGGLLQEAITEENLAYAELLIEQNCPGHRQREVCDRHAIFYDSKMFIITTETVDDYVTFYFKVEKSQIVFTRHRTDKKPQQ